LQTATSLLSQFGYHAVGIDRIIAESRVAKMTMYRHFPIKDSLVSEVLQTRMEGIKAALSAKIEYCSSAEQKLKAIFDWHDAWLHDPEFHGCMFMRAASEYGSGDSKIRDIADRQKAELTATIASILRTGGYNAASARKLAKSIVMLLDGAIVSAEVSNNRRAAKEAWAAAEVLLTGTSPS
jgi:AcrR family transcriptional regulator